MRFKIFNKSSFGFGLIVIGVLVVSFAPSGVRAIDTHSGSYFRNQTRVIGTVSAVSGTDISLVSVRSIFPIAQGRTALFATSTPMVVHVPGSALVSSASSTAASNRLRWQIMTGQISTTTALTADLSNIKVGQKIMVWAVPNVDGSLTARGVFSNRSSYGRR